MSPTSSPQLLGELELAVMEHLWNHGADDVRGTHLALGARRGIVSNTVQSTLERLHRKGRLSREKRGHAFVYRPRLSRIQFQAEGLLALAAHLSGGDGECMAASFVEAAAGVDPELLSRLERRLAERRREDAERRDGAPHA